MNEDKIFEIDDILNEINSLNSEDNSLDFSIDDILNEYGSKKQKEEKKEEIASPIVEQPKSEPLEEFDLKKHIKAIVENEKLTPLSITNEESTTVNDVISKKEQPNYYNKKIDDYFDDFYENGRASSNKIEEKEEAEQVKFENFENTDEIKEKNVATPFGGFMGKLFNESDDTEEPIVNVEKTFVEEIDEYETVDDTASIQNDLEIQKKEALFKLIFCGISALVLLFINFIAQYNKLPLFLKPPENAFAFGITNTALCLIVIASGFKTFTYGIKNLFTFKPTNDSLPALAMLVSIIHSVLVMLSIVGFQNNIFMYSGIASFAFLLTLYGKYLHIVSAIKNFAIVSSNENKHTLTMLAPNELPKGVNIQINEGCAGVKANFLSGFLERAFSDNPSQNYSKKTVPIVFIAIIAISVFSIFQGISTLPMKIAAVTAVCSSFMAELAFILPYFIETSKARKQGCALNGYTSAKQFSNIFALSVKDTQIFTNSNTTITGMKMFSDTEIPDAVVKIASIFNYIGGPLAGAFLSVLDNKTEHLKEVNDVIVHEGKGISCKIDGEKVFVGNTQFLKSCGIRLPSQDYEASLARGNKSVLLFAQKGTLSALFVANYAINNSIFSAVNRLENEGIALMVYTDDYNITEELLQKKFKTKNLEISVFGSETAPKLKEILKPKERASSGIVSITGLIGIEIALRLSRRLKRTVKASIILRTVSIFIGLAVAAFMIISNSDMTPLQIMGFSSLWGVLTFITALIGL